MGKLVLNEDLFDDNQTIDIPPEDIGGIIIDKSAPAPGEDTGVANILISLIKDEWEAIEGYNNALANIQDEKIRHLIEDIVNEENIHVGQLEAALQTISPNATSILDGELEAKEEQGVVIENLNIKNSNKIDESLEDDGIKEDGTLDWSGFDNLNKRIMDMNGEE